MNLAPAISDFHHRPVNRWLIPRANKNTGAFARVRRSERFADSAAAARYKCDFAK
jgi:hypothetical protein